ncbi:MAG: hypothetical protein ACOVMQ_10125 [Cyclobacteriaceae bacterium]|jgi:predicted flap endonuclease-1-like 5' DNA nuclease
MKLTYSFIGAFFVWCLVASKWYIIGVKGLSTDPAQFDSQAATIAIFEIVVMLVVAVFIGFAIAWYQQQSTIDQTKKTSTQALQNEKQQLDQMKTAAMRSVREMELNLIRTEAVLKEGNQRLADESQRLKAALKEKDETVALLKEELQSIRPKIQLADVELGRYAMQIKQLEMQLANEKMITDGLKQELEKSHTPKRKPMEALIEKVSEKNRDDLKLISGIGPVIESKLNAIGIYTFKQISEFTPETIDFVTSSIKFFPDRIGRDNWIGQAAALARHRK